jgi:hypothetical protein
MMAGASLLIAACSNVSTTTAATYNLTIASTNPSSGVSIALTSAENNSTTYQTTGVSLTYAAGSSFTLTAPPTAGLNAFSSWSGCAYTTTVTCAVTLNADTTVSANYVTTGITTPTVTVTPSSPAITTGQSLSVTVAVAGTTGGVTPTGTVTLSSGSYTSAVTTLSGGNAQIGIPANILSVGSDTLQVVYTPDAASTSIYSQASGSGLVTVFIPSITSPTVTVTPSPSSITTAQGVAVTVTVAGTAGDTPTGTVTLYSGNYSSAVTTLSSGSVIIDVHAGSLAVGNDTLLAVYTPDTASAPIYSQALGTSSVTVTAPAITTPTVTVTPSSPTISTTQGVAVTVTVAGLAGGATPTGTVTLSSGAYASAVTTLGNGSAIIDIPAGSLATGNDTLHAAYTPDTASAAVYTQASGTGSVIVSTPGLITPTVTVTPSPSSITTAQGVSVTVAVVGLAGGATPTGTVTLSSGAYTSAATTLGSGSAIINIPAGSLALGSDTLHAVYTPDTASASVYSQALGSGSVTVTVPPLTTPTVTVTPWSTSITSVQGLAVTVTVVGAAGGPTPTGTVTLISGSYNSTPVPLETGSHVINILAGSLAVGTDTLLASYAPDSASSSIYTAATATSSPITVTTATTGANTITVDQSTIGPPVSAGLMGMNMAYWYDPSTSGIVPALQAAGIKAIRWPGGTAANVYHWATNTTCFNTTPIPAASSFDTFLADVIHPGNFDLDLTVNYGTNAACTGPGDPAEAAAWIQNAKNNGNNVSHVTVGNEDWGSWVTDLHAIPYDPTTYANATANDYYPQIKAVNPNVLVGVGLNPWNDPPWDPIVLAQAKYDFVEYHFYPQGPRYEDDTFLVQQGAQQLYWAIIAIKQELATAGVPNTPIYIGEIGSVYAEPGKQTMSISQALYAGQVLGEMMNQGVSLSAWWLAFGSCDSDPTNENFSSSLYGWQNFGGYMVFSDGLPEYGCDGSGIPTIPTGTQLPTARAFQLFSNVAIDGEHVLTATAAGDTTDVRAYAATHKTGTALVIFNDNETTSEQVTISLSNQTTSSDVTMDTYSKAIYDQSQNNVWAPPTNTDLGAETFPLVLTLDPWSMNVLIVK